MEKQVEISSGVVVSVLDHDAATCHGNCQYLSLDGEFCDLFLQPLTGTRGDKTTCPDCYAAVNRAGKDS